MRIGGLQKLSLIDYPGKPSAVIFTQGCNFRCRYCHNPQLVYPERFCEPLAFDQVYTFLRGKRRLLEGVVFSGGEPTLQPDLAEVVGEVRSLGFAVKLDTNGSNPDVLAEVLPLLAYLAMDIKAPFGPAYSRVCGVTVDMYDIRRSILLVRAAGIPYQFRTTFHPEYLPPGFQSEIQQLLAEGERYITRIAS